MNRRLGASIERKEPSWLHLAEDEAIVWESRPHVIAMGRRLLVGIGLLLGGLVLAIWNATSGGYSGLITLFGFGIVGLGGVLIGIQYLYWTNTRYVITSEELYKKRGIVSRDVTQFRLDRIQNTSLTQSVPGRILGYGDLTIFTAGSGDPELTFETTPRPDRAGSALSRHLDDSSTRHSPENATV